MAKRKHNARRLATGGYRYRGKTLRFSDLPESIQHEYRSKWAQQGAKARRHALTNIVTVIEGEQPGEIRRNGLITIAADYQPGFGNAYDPLGLRRIMSAIMADQRKYLPSYNIGVWAITLEWPDDDRGTALQPYRTTISRGIQYNEPANNKLAKDYFQEMINSPQALSYFNKRGDGPGSRGKGSPRIVKVAWMMWKVNKPETLKGLAA
jgi:hypothetical protein